MRRLALPMVLLLVVAPTTACRTAWDYTVEVVSPAPGTAVTVPFEVALNANVPLGTTEEGLHHVHIWFGSDEAAYIVVEASRTQVDNAPNGEHAMHVSLHYPDHSATGAKTSVPLIISGGTNLPEDAVDS